MVALPSVVEIERAALALYARVGYACHYDYHHCKPGLQ